jgi:hypothetical protein
MRRSPSFSESKTTFIRFLNSSHLRFRRSGLRKRRYLSRRMLHLPQSQQKPPSQMQPLLVMLRLLPKMLK